MRYIPLEHRATIGMNGTSAGASVMKLAKAAGVVDSLIVCIIRTLYYRSKKSWCRICDFLLQDGDAQQYLLFRYGARTLLLSSQTVTNDIDQQNNIVAQSSLFHRVGKYGVTSKRVRARRGVWLCYKVNGG